MSTPIAEIDHPRGRIEIYADTEALAEGAAEAFAAAASAAVAARGRAVVALSGGSTPKRMGELLAVAPWRDRVPWDRVIVFWGDERWVPLDHPESNAGEAKRTFLDRVPVPPDAIHPWPTEMDDAAAAATAYERTLRQTFGDSDELPRFDLVLLGIGDDGHTASLFPGTAALDERTAWAVANEVPQLATTRLTLTAPVLNAGREIVFLVGGAGKAATLARVLATDGRADELPARLIQPTDGQRRWLIDRAAAADLTDGEDPTNG